ncbi:hypothetical protein ACFU3E_17140 [Streptomyces sp. NPDC057424]|uniref:zinc finger domain-containing protein n=1 Tax=Streptomyces sp. NPDC057424 TaxID=3346127 RepID=UPI00369DBCC5
MTRVWLLKRRTARRAWARTVACCPTCQVTPGVPCHHDGIALPDGAVHPRRYQEAEETAA